jgi:hypothetical protein
MLPAGSAPVRIDVAALEPALPFARNAEMTAGILGADPDGPKEMLKLGLGTPERGSGGRGERRGCEPGLSCILSAARASERETRSLRGISPIISRASRLDCQQWMGGLGHGDLESVDAVVKAGERRVILQDAMSPVNGSTCLGDRTGHQGWKRRCR